MLGGANASTPARRWSCEPEPTSTAGRSREAALQLRVGLEALLVELRGALADPGHEEDMATLEAAGRGRRAGERGAAAASSAPSSSSAK